MTQKKITKQAAAILATNASTIVRRLQSDGLSFRQIESITGIDKGQLLRISKGQTTSEESFRRLATVAIERNVLLSPPSPYISE